MAGARVDDVRRVVAETTPSSPGVRITGNAGSVCVDWIASVVHPDGVVDAGGMRCMEGRVEPARCHMRARFWVVVWLGRVADGARRYWTNECALERRVEVCPFCGTGPAGIAGCLEPVMLEVIGIYSIELFEPTHLHRLSIPKTRMETFRKCRKMFKSFILSGPSSSKPVIESVSVRFLYELVSLR